MAFGISSENNMKNTVWDKLPYDLQILVLLKLPLVDLLKLSFTCKYLKSLLWDPYFAIQYDRCRFSHPTLFLTNYTLDEVMYWPVFRSAIWQDGKETMFTWKNPFVHDSQSCRRRLSSYADGFVCLVGYVDYVPSMKMELLVFNPLFPEEKKILRSLPDIAEPGSALYTGIAMDRKNGICKIVLWHISEEINFRIAASVYNFKEGVWKNIPEWNGIPKDRGYLEIERCNQFISDRFLCWLVYSTDDPISSINTVLVFDVEEESWMEPIPLPPISSNDLFINIAEHEKQLCMLSKASKKEKNNSTMGLWKFNMEGRVWRFAKNIPPIPVPFDTTGHPPIGGSGFWRVHQWNQEELLLWIYDMSDHS